MNGSTERARDFNTETQRTQRFKRKQLNFTKMLMALSAARWVLIPVQCEYYAARRLTRLLDVVVAVQERNQSDLTCFLLATMYDQRNRICQGVLEQLRGSFTQQMLKTVIGVDTRLRESPALGELIITYAPRTRASQQYRQLARELDTKLEQLTS